MGRLARSPTLQTLLLFVAVFAVQVPLSFLGLSGLFVLTGRADPVPLVLSVYAHGGVAHLLANSVALVLVGVPVEFDTTALRYHAFFLASGVVAGLAQVWVGGALRPGPAGVLGASGAVFALGGYLLASNVATEWAFQTLRIPPKVTAVLLVVVAAGVTLATAAPGVALIAHFTGLLLGLAAGRVGLLRVRR
ncbi:rhomboid family intramembrane serine protease [Halobium salinum]|uniref:Rhomboid family intramembrane serine protease n=1 Tax=Halobium salinum TaxID=1364940 RepID=A0ABD5PBF3_9EURY|nr:rhomboid family intramembrane serine protease [Halobium salinum]